VTPIALAAARPHHVDAGAGPEVLHDEIERRGAVSAPLVPLVDQQPPQVLRDVFGVVDLVADHHKAHRTVLGIDGPVDGATSRIVDRLGQRLGNTGDEPLLHGRHAERLDLAAIRVVDRPE
jgi:hypothetical protein